MCPKLIAGFDSDRTTTKGEQNMSQEKPQTISSKRAEDTAFETFVFGMVHLSKMIWSIDPDWPNGFLINLNVPV